MTSFSSRSLLVAAAVATLGWAGCRRSDPAAPASAAVDAAPPPAAATTSEDQSDLPKLGAAPAWKLQRVDGSMLDSNELKGKVVVLDFWATWCGPCRMEIPGYIEMQQRYQDQGLVIVGVSLDQGGPAVVQEFAQKMGINYPLVMGDAEVADAFGGVQAIPTTFLIDRNGQIRDRKMGAAHLSAYEPLVKSLL